MAKARSTAGCFLGPLHLQFIDGRRWRLLNSFGYVAKDNRHVLVPRGFITDLASIPRVFWRVIPPTGPYGPATVIHDFLYSNQPCSRKTADRLFLEGMKVLKVAWWKRRVMYRAVRVFGGVPWQRHLEVLQDEHRRIADGDDVFRER